LTRARDSINFFAAFSPEGQKPLLQKRILPRFYGSGTSFNHCDMRARNQVRCRLAY
jgi:hypothetical protein